MVVPVFGQFRLHCLLDELPGVVGVTECRWQQGDCPEKETPRPESHWTSTWMVGVNRCCGSLSLFPHPIGCAGNGGRDSGWSLFRGNFNDPCYMTVSSMCCMQRAGRRPYNQSAA